MMTSYDKALVPLVVGVIFFALSHFGVAQTDSLTTFITTVITGLVVYVTPNKTE